MIHTLWRTVWRSLKKLGIKLPYDLTIILLGIYSKNIIIQKKHMYPNVHCSIIYNSQDTEAT